MVMGLALMFSLPTSSKNNSKSSFTTHVTVTTYNAVRSQCDKTPTITADGTRIDHKKLKNGKQRIVAISRDLLWAIPLGSTILIEGHGRYVVRDTMNPRFNHCIDILQHPSKENFKKKKIKVKLVEKAKKKPTKKATKKPTKKTKKKPTKKTKKKPTKA